MFMCLVIAQARAKNDFFFEDVGAVLFIWSLRDFRQAPEPLKIDPCVLVVLDVLQKIVEIPRKILSKPSLHGKSCRCQCLKSGRMKSLPGCSWELLAGGHGREILVKIFLHFFCAKILSRSWCNPLSPGMISHRLL